MDPITQWLNNWANFFREANRMLSTILVYDFSCKIGVLSLKSASLF